MCSVLVSDAIYYIKQVNSAVKRLNLHGCGCKISRPKSNTHVLICGYMEYVKMN